MMPMTPSSSSSDVAIERVEMPKQRKNSAAAFVFDIADSAADAMNAPAIEIVQQPSGDELSSSFSSNEFVEDAASTTSAPDVVVQSSIKDAMALIQAEEREAKIASGEIVGAYPFSFSSLRFCLVLVLLHRRSTVIWAIHSVPLSQHYSVQLHRLLTASAAFDDLIFVSMDWRPENRLNCRRGVSAYIFSPLFSSPRFL